MELHDAIIALIEDKVKATHLPNKIGVITDSHNGIMLTDTYEVKHTHVFESYDDKHNVTYKVIHQFKMRSIESHDEDELYFKVTRVDRTIAVRLAEETFNFNLKMEYIGEEVTGTRKMILGLIEGDYFLREYLKK